MTYYSLDLYKIIDNNYKKLNLEIRFIKRNY